VGKFVEIGDELQQVGIRVDVEAGALAVGGQFAFNSLATFGGAHDDAVGAELLLIVDETADANLRLAEEAMADGHIAGRDAREGEFQRLAVEDADEPADGGG